MSFLSPPKPGQVPGKKRPVRASTVGLPSNPKIYKLNCKRKFVDDWNVEFSWVQHNLENYVLLCKVCIEFPAIADRYDSIATAIRERNEAWIKAKRNNNDKCWLNYRVLRNKCTRLIKTTKSEYYLNLINENL
jgi:hypothetical protein